jgi:S-layer protein
MAIQHEAKCHALFLGYLGRPPSATELDYWSGKLAANSNGPFASGLVAHLQAQTSFVADLLKSPEQLVADLFVRLTGSELTDMSIFNHFVNGVRNGMYDAESLPVAILRDCGFMPKSDGAGGLTYGAPDNAPADKSAVDPVADAALVASLTSAIENKVTVSTAFTDALDTPAENAAYSSSSTAAETLLASVTSDDATAAAATADVEATVAATVDAGNAAAGQTFALTTGVDKGAAFTGGTGTDTFEGSIDSTLTPSTTTWTALDAIDGGAGTDTFNLTAITDVALPGGATLSNIENVNIAAAAKVGTFAADDAGALDLSTVFADVTNLTITSGSQADFKAGTGTAVNLSGVTGGVEIVGGASQTVSLAAQGGAVQVSGATGAVSVTSAKQGANTIDVDGGSTITVNTTSTADNGAITIGTTTPATGAVSVTSNLNGDGTATLDQADIAVKGGSTVTVNSNLTIAAKDQTAGAVHTFGDVLVTGDGKTTSVTVNQTYAETEFTKAAVAVVKETSVVTFSAMTSGQTLTFNGLTFTASKALTAAEVAAAFSNLTAADTQSANGPVANGLYSGTFNTAVWTSGAASGASVTFTATDEDETDLAFSGTATAPTQVKAAGTAAVSAVTSTNTVTYGAVRVDGAATESITTLTVNGYGSADLGNTAANDLNALTALSLANSGGTATVDTSAATLGLTVNKVDHAVDLSGAASLKTLNVTATGANSTFGLTAAAVEALTVAGDKVLDIDTGSTLTALKTVTVSGSAGLSIDASGANVTSVTTTDTTGAVTAKLDGSKATYTGGAGVDTVTLTAATVAKNIALGGGDDKLDGSLATLTGTFTFDGGTGTNTLVLDDAQAATLAGSTAFEGKISNFSKLSLGQVATTVQSGVNLANMDDISYVITAGSADTAQVKTLTLTVGTAIAAGDTASLTINGTTYTTAALLAAATATDIAAALDTAVGGAYTVTNALGVLTVTSATGGTTTLSGLTVTGTGTVTGVEAVTSSQLTLTNMTNAGTVELTAAGVDTVVTMTDATGTADSLNILTTDLATVNVGTVTANGVETINVTTTDTFVDANADGVDDANSVATLAVKSDKVATINVAGAGDITLVATDSTLEEVDASTLSGVLTFTAAVNDLVVKGGTAGDALTAAADDVALYGNAGADTLTVTPGLRVNLYGGDGADTFVFGTGASATLDAYTVINGVATGDTLKLTGADSFSSTSIALSVGADETLLNYANQACKVLGEDDMGWFQKGGNTYIVMDTNNGDGDAFVAGTDMIVMITGQVDLSTASYNIASNTLEIA